LSGLAFDSGRSGTTANAIGVFDTRENAATAISLLNGGSVCGFQVGVRLTPDAGDEEEETDEEDEPSLKRTRTAPNDERAGELFSRIEGKFVRGYGAPKIEYRANFLCMLLDKKKIGEAQTKEEVVEVLRQSCLAVTGENAEASSLLVVGKFVTKFMDGNVNCDELKQYLRTTEAFAAHNGDNTLERKTLASLRDAVLEGKLCGGAGYGTLLTREDFDQLKSSPRKGVGKSVDLSAWDVDVGLFGDLGEVTVAVGLARANAYLLPGDAKTTVAAEIIEPWRRAPCPCWECRSKGTMQVEFLTLKDALEHEGTKKPNHWP
jgi:hypothetical protein